MAEEHDSDSSFEGEIDSRSDVYLNKVLRDVVDESLDGMPDSGDEFWKPVECNGLKENNCLETKEMDSRHRQVDSYGKQIPVANEEEWYPLCDLDNNGSCSDNDYMNILRRSKSEDILAQATKPLAQDHTAFSSPEKQFRSLTESSSSADLDDVFVKTHPGAFNSFFDEYEKKIDQLEYCDYALEESILHIQTKVSEMEDLLDEIDHEDKACRKEGNTEDPTEQPRKENESINDENNDEPDEERSTVGDLKRTFISGLSSALKEMQLRFENFVGQVGETIQLGALAAKHSQRVEGWANLIQNMYAAVKEDQAKMVKVLEDREMDLMKFKRQLNSEMTQLRNQRDSFEQSIIDLTEKYKDCQSRDLSNKEIIDKAEEVKNEMKNTRFSQEQTITLDLSRQAKISELKLIIMRQQGYIQKLELQNKELDGILRGIMYNAESENSMEDSSPAYVLRESSIPVPEKINTVSSVLECEKSQYLPGKSTDMDLVALQTFNIGTGTSSLTAENEEIFDPRKLNYINLDTTEEVDNVEETTKKDEVIHSDPCENQGSNVSPCDDQSDKRPLSNIDMAAGEHVGLEPVNKDVIERNVHHSTGDVGEATDQKVQQIKDCMDHSYAVNNPDVNLGLV